MRWRFHVLILFLLVPHVYAQACVPGYTGPDGGPCTPCGNGFYKTTVGTAVCTMCSGVTWSNCTACTAKTSCLCNAGYTGPDGGDCLQCDSGKYKSQTGSATCTSCDAGTYTAVSFAAITCTLCPAGTYRMGTGGININACTFCTYAKYLPTTGSTAEAACIPCSLGYQGVLQAQSSVASCTLCVAGTYRDSFASPTCTQCPRGKASAIIGSTSLQICVDCPAGTYSYIGSSTCILCPAGTYSVQVAAYSIMTCLDCFTNPDQTIKGSSTCFDPNCAAGLTGPYGGPCTACAAGKYKGSTGSAACTNCRAQSNSSLASTSISACLCNAGLFLYGLDCYGCEAGSYKDVIGNQACTACPLNAYPEDIPNANWDTPRLSSSCIACPSGTSCELVRSACWYLAACWCDAGHYGLRGSACLPCEAGTYAGVRDSSYCFYCDLGYYQDQMGATSCKQCPSGMSSDDYRVTCTGCPTNTVFDAATNACVTECVAGYTGPNGGVCTACAAGTWKSTTGSGACSACGARTYSTSIGAKNVSACVPCPANSGASCVGCGDASACTCNPGHEFLNTSLTTTTPTPTTTTPTTTPTCVVCRAGTSGPCGGPCANCSAGTYSVRNDSDVLGNAICTACPANSGATCVGCKTQSECLCNAGYAMSGALVEDQCTACIAGKYKSEDGNAVPNTLQLTRARHAEACTYCANGTYSSAFAGSTTCLSCAPDTGQNCNADNVDPATGEGCSNETHCRCNDTYYGQDGGPCAACPAGSGGCFATANFRCRDISNCLAESCGDGTYPGVGGACTACPPDATGWNCAIGIFGTPDCNELNDCYDGCARGQFGMGYNFDGCDVCPPDSGENCYGVPGETCASTAECICNAGYSGPAGGPCA